MTEALSDAKQTLLHALDAIEEIEADMGGKVWALTVVYSITKIDEETGDTHEDGGWVSTAEPHWVTAALLRRTADYVDASTYITEREDD